MSQLQTVTSKVSRDAAHILASTLSDSDLLLRSRNLVSVVPVSFALGEVCGTKFIVVQVRIITLISTNADRESEKWEVGIANKKYIYG